MPKGFTYTRKVTKVKNIKLDCCLILRSCCLFLIPKKPEWNQFILKQDTSLSNELKKKKTTHNLASSKIKSDSRCLSPGFWLSQSTVKLSFVVFGCQMKSCVRPWDVLIGDFAADLFLSSGFPNAPNNVRYKHASYSNHVSGWSILSGAHSTTKAVQCHVHPS